jgi:GNAT superfamily N-acetyltransferase
MPRTQLAPDDQRSDAGRDGRLAGPGSTGTVEIRAASAADCEAIRSFVTGLSPRARFFRFFSPVASLSSGVLRTMCGAGLGTDALVATENGVIIGHAMAAEVAGPDGRRVADIGLVVTDRWQNRGVGSQMLSQVIALAAARGVGGLVMEVLPENRRMLAMITRRWTDARQEFGGGSVTVRVSLQASGGRDGAALSAA